MLRDYFPTKSSMGSHARRYNRILASFYDEIRDFICLHYCLTARDDSDYWRTCRDHPALPESLQHKLELWRTRLPTENDLDYVSERPAFSAISYVYVCAGMGHLPREGPAAAAMADAKFARAVFEDRRRSIDEILATAPDHWTLLQRIHGIEGTP